MEFASVLLDDKLCLASLLVDVALGRDPLDEVLVLDVTWALANDRNVVLLPVSNALIDFDFRPVGEKDTGSHFDRKALQRLDRVGFEQFFVLFQRSALIADDVEGTVLVENNPHSLFVLHSAQILVEQDSVVLGIEVWGDVRRSDTSQVERSHRELRSRFPDRLCGDDSDCLSKPDSRACSEV